MKRHPLPTVPGLIFALFVPSLTGCTAGKQLLVVGVSVADVRSLPGTMARPGLHDPQEETQLIYGEHVRVLKTESGWAKIQAVEQPEYTHSRSWEGYPGWVEASALTPPRNDDAPNIVVTAKWASLWKDAYRSGQLGVQFPMGTSVAARNMGNQLWQVRLADGTVAWMDYKDAVSNKTLSALSLEQKREAIIQSAEKFIGDPYFWGGRSPHADSKTSAATGVDCSGLINLSFRTVGMIIPRDANEQHLKARPVAHVQPGDLIFLSERSNPKRIVHVMLYAGDGELIEAPGTGQAVRRIPVMARLGLGLEKLKPEDVIDNQTVFFGSLLF